MFSHIYIYSPIHVHKSVQAVSAAMLGLGVQTASDTLLFKAHRDLNFEKQNINYKQGYEK